MPSSRPSGPRTRAGSRPGTRPVRRTASPRAGAGGGGAGRARTPDQRPARPRFTGRAAILVLVLAVLMVSYASSMRAYLEQQKHLQGLRHDIATSKARIADLQREKRRWQDPAYVEAQARRRFGWVMPGEIGYQVIGEDGKPLGHRDSLSRPKPAAGESEPTWWQAAWGSVEAAGNPPVARERPQPLTEIRLPKKHQR